MPIGVLPVSGDVVRSWAGWRVFTGPARRLMAFGLPFVFAGIVLVADEAEGDREGAALMAFHQLSESDGVALLRLGNEPTVFLRFAYPCLLRVGRVRSP
jgi:hypothetical protein